MLERGICQGLTTKGTKDTKKYYPCPLRTSSSQLAANLIHGKAVSKASFEPFQQVTAMIMLNPSSNVTAGDRWVFAPGSLLFKKTHQTGGQRPEAQNCLAGHHLVVVASEQVFLILEKGFHSVLEK